MGSLSHRLMCLNGCPPAVALSGMLAEVSFATESASLSVGFEMTALPLFLLLDCRSVVRLLSDSACHVFPVMMDSIPSKMAGQTKPFLL